MIATCFFCTYPIAPEVVGDRSDERHALSAEQVAEARSAIERARAAARENDAALRAAPSSLAEIAPRGDQGGCPYTLPTDVRWAQGRS